MCFKVWHCHIHVKSLHRVEKILGNDDGNRWSVQRLLWFLKKKIIGYILKMILTDLLLVWMWNGKEVKYIILKYKRFQVNSLRTKTPYKLFIRVYSYFFILIFNVSFLHFNILEIECLLPLILPFTSCEKIWNLLKTMLLSWALQPVTPNSC